MDSSKNLGCVGKTFPEKPHKELYSVSSCVSSESNYNKEDNMKNNKINPVLKDWVLYLSWKEQTGLISAIRGIDFDTENEEYKNITRMIRNLVLNNADSKTTFMTDEVFDKDYVVRVLTEMQKTVRETKTLFDNIFKAEYNVPSHWYDHIILALKIISKEHPNNYIKKYWVEILEMIKEK